MAKSHRVGFSELQLLHKYLEHITELINNLIQDESAAIVIACRVFEDFAKRRSPALVKTQADCLKWLEGRAKTLCDLHLHRLQNEKIKSAAIAAAIHDYPSSTL